jgi:hypothetical protein
MNRTTFPRIGPWADPRWTQRHDGWTTPFVLLARLFPVTRTDRRKHP